MNPTNKIESSGKVLRRLFFTMFLRGHSARGISRETAPKSVLQKLGLSLFVFCMMGFFVVILPGQNIFEPFSSSSLHYPRDGRHVYHRRGG